MEMPVVHLLGDSTLDNLYWIRKDPGTFEPEFAQEHCIEGILKKKLPSEYEVCNHAYDGFTTSDVLNGGVPGAVLENKSDYLSARKISNCSEVIPLDYLAIWVRAKSEKDHYVVLSVGGNDFRVLLRQPWKILGAIGEVQKRYLEIMDRLEELGPRVKPILMFQYRTQVNGKQQFPLIF